MADLLQYHFKQYVTSNGFDFLFVHSWTTSEPCGRLGAQLFFREYVFYGLPYRFIRWKLSIFGEFVDSLHTAHRKYHSIICTALAHDWFYGMALHLVSDGLQPSQSSLDICKVYENLRVHQVDECFSLFKIKGNIGCFKKSRFHICAYMFITTFFSKDPIYTIGVIKTVFQSQLHSWGRRNRDVFQKYMYIAWSMRVNRVFYKNLTMKFTTSIQEHVRYNKCCKKNIYDWFPFLYSKNERCKISDADKF